MALPFEIKLQLIICPGRPGWLVTVAIPGRLGQSVGRGRGLWGEGGAPLGGEGGRPPSACRDVSSGGGGRTRAGLWTRGPVADTSQGPRGAESHWTSSLRSVHSGRPAELRAGTASFYGAVLSRRHQCPVLYCVSVSSEPDVWSVTVFCVCVLINRENLAVKRSGTRLLLYRTFVGL